LKNAVGMSRLPLFALFLLSGFSGLVFEILWVRISSLALGVTVYAVSIVVSTFMGGLALGGWLASFQADKHKLGVKTYALLELGIAASALLATWFLGQLPHFATHSAMTVILASLAMLVPCTLMGATIPVLTRAIFEPDQPSRVVGWLYATNTLGAMIGAFSADMFLVSRLGIWGTALVAGSLNLTAGVVGLWLPTTTAPQRRVLKNPSPKGSLTRLFWAYGLAGITSLALQVVWVRLLGVAIESKIWVVSTILTTFLGCLAVGSWLGSLLVGRIRHKRQALSRVFVAIGISSLLGALALALMQESLWRPPLGDLLWKISLPFGPKGWGTVQCLAQSIILFGLPTLLMGLAFPLVCAVAFDEHEGISQPIGQLYTVNTVGAIFGSFLAGFLLLPYLGVQWSFLALALLSLLSAALVAPERISLALLLAVTVGCATLPADWLIRRYHYPVYQRNYNIKPDQIVEFREDLYGSVAVGKNTMAGDVLMINGTRMMSSDTAGRRYARLMAHLPLALHPKPKKMLVICFGLGMTFGAASLYPDLDLLQCVELSPSVLAVAHHFSEYNENVINRQDSRIRITLDDGRNFQFRTKERYDVITFEPPPPTAPGVVNLYSKDYYELCKQHLTPDGIVCQWAPLHMFSEPTARMVVRSFVEVFPNATLWEGSVDDYLLVGSPGATKVDKARILEYARTFEKPLRQIGIEDGYDMMALFKRGPNALHSYAATGLTITDNFPHLEYADSLFPPVSELRQNDLSQLQSTITGLEEKELATVFQRSKTLDLLQQFRYAADPAEESIGFLARYHWAREVQKVYPSSPYVETILEYSPDRLQYFEARAKSDKGLAEFVLRLLLAKQYARAEALLKDKLTAQNQQSTLFLLAGLIAREQGQPSQQYFQEVLKRTSNEAARKFLESQFQDHPPK